jgi:D-allose transport system substrate-binding protein
MSISAELLYCRLEPGSSGVPSTTKEEADLMRDRNTSIISLKDRPFDGRIAALLWILVLPLFFIPSPAVAGEDEYLFILKGRGNVFWRVVRQGVEETARERSITAVVLHTDDDQSPESQLTMCQTALARKPRVLVMGAATKVVGIECFKKAAKLGIPVADVDGNVTIEDAKDAGLDLAFSVGSDNTKIGQQGADYIASASATREPRILVIKGLPGSIVSEKRAQGFLNQIALKLPGAAIVAAPSADWDRMKAMNTALDFMRREPKLDYIFSVSDVMTMGIVEAVRVAGRVDSVKIVSVDGIKDARDAIAEGRIAANVAQLPYLMGKRAVELAIRARNDGVRLVREFTATPTLTKEALERKDDPSLHYLR